MAIRGAEYLKARFADGNRPTGVDFADLVDDAIGADSCGVKAD